MCEGMGMGKGGGLMVMDGGSTGIWGIIPAMRTLKWKGAMGTAEHSDEDLVFCVEELIILYSEAGYQERVLESDLSEPVFRFSALGGRRGIE